MSYSLKILNTHLSYYRKQNFLNLIKTYCTNVNFLTRACFDFTCTDLSLSLIKQMTIQTIMLSRLIFFTVFVRFEIHVLCHESQFLRTLLWFTMISSEIKWMYEYGIHFNIWLDGCAFYTKRSSSRPNLHGVCGFNLFDLSWILRPNRMIDGRLPNLSNDPRFTSGYSFSNSLGYA